jgi:hypothetical protein
MNHRIEVWCSALVEEWRVEQAHKKMRAESHLLFNLERLLQFKHTNQVIKYLIQQTMRELYISRLLPLICASGRLTC